MPWPLGWFIPMGAPLMEDAFMPVPMFPGRDGGPRGPGWFMNWLLYAWFGAIWKEELIWKTQNGFNQASPGWPSMQQSEQSRLKFVKSLKSDLFT